MITKYFIIVAVLFMASIAFSQAPETLWTRTYGGADEDGAHSICFNGSAGYAIIGYTKSFGAGNRDIYFLKTTPFGDTIQTMTYGGAGEECGYYIKHTMDDGYIITGYGGGYPTHSALLIHKTDAGGNIIWSKSYGPDYWSFGYCVQPVIDDAGIETGYIISARLGDVNGHCLLKTDINGDTLWTRVYPVSYNACALAVDQTQDKGYIIAGCSGAGTFETSWNVDLIKADSIGVWKWTRVYGDRRYGYDDAAYSIEQTSDRGYIIAAITMTYGMGGYDAWLIKTDVNGEILWARTYGGTAEDCGFSVARTVDGGYVMSGHTESFGEGGRDVYVIRTNCRGDTLWTKTIGGPNDDASYQILVTNKGEYVIVGYTESFGAGGRDVYLIKLASDIVYVDDENYFSAPVDFVLRQNNPNPFNASTIIKYELPRQSQVSIAVYDILGRRITTLQDGLQPAGYHQALWRAEDVASGVYFYKLQAGDYSESKKMVLVK